MTEASEKEEHVEYSPFAKNLECLLENIESLNTTFPLIMVVLSEIGKNRAKEHLEFLEKNGTLSSEEENKKSYTLDQKHLHNAKRIKKRSQRISKSFDLIPRNFVVSLISEYDSFLGSLLKEFYIKKPELLNTIERQLTFSELASYKSIEEAREYILEKEVEGFLRKSHVEHFQLLENKFSIDLRKGLESWSKFVELTERRNLFVHCNGTVSSQYIKTCKENGETNSDIKIGDKLDADRKYVEETFEIINEISIKLTHVLWRKVFPEERKTADNALLSLSFELLQEERYKLVINILDLFVNTIKKFHDETFKRMIIVNLAIAYKLSDQKDKCSKELSRLDWSATNYAFKMANSVLNEEYDKASSYMQNAVSTKELSEYQFLEWPLFKEYRESEQFTKSFTELFGKEPFETESVDTDDEGTDDSSDEEHDN